ncbi:hypothetical protein [Limimaricola cinnabarinus]|jgi:hypothetical protein|uniref:Uncharacterized protein n=1 Tax=Limimaricola cinnabarinus TaxID=1125964 RepID=A0A2G1MDC4_9RHOB|nr:hypothetical protein [Limimaricola cinnabarinus]PHP26728.1 hypothetical protein CJ301_14640 [Limimaricola cinnabarinus]
MKSLILAALVAATAAPAFAAANNFGTQRSVEAASFVEIDTLRSQDGGRVEILDGSSLSDAVSLGGTDVRPGLVSDVRVQLAHKPFRSNVLAVLYDDNGNVTATRQLRVLD